MIITINIALTLVMARDDGNDHDNEGDDDSLRQLGGCVAATAISTMLNQHQYTWVHMGIYIYTLYKYIYIFIYRDRDRERDKETETERDERWRNRERATDSQIHKCSVL